MGIALLLASFILTAGLLTAFVGIEVIDIMVIRWISGYITIGALRVCVGIAVHCFGLYSFIIPINIYRSLSNILLDVIDKKNKYNS